MKYKYMAMLLQYVYEKCGLGPVEEEFIERGVKPIEDNNLFSYTSKYFVIRNPVFLERLAEDKKAVFTECFSQPIETLLEKQNKEKVYSIIESTYKDLIFPDLECGFCYYGPIDPEFRAPTDAIVLGFNYYAFIEDDDFFETKRFEQEDFINERLNKIQFELAAEAGLKIAVIKYDEVVYEWSVSPE